MNGTLLLKDLPTDYRAKLKHLREVKGRPGEFQMRRSILDTLRPFFPSSKSKDGFAHSLVRNVKTVRDYEDAIAWAEQELARADEARRRKTEGITLVYDGPLDDTQFEVAVFAARLLGANNLRFGLDNAAKRTPVSGKPFGIEDVIQVWQRQRRSAAKPKAVADERRKLTRLFAYLGIPPDLTKLKRADLQRYKEHLLETEGADVCANHIAAIKKMITLVYNENKFPEGHENPAERIVVPAKRNRGKRQSYTDEQAEAILAALPGEPPEIEWPIRICAALGVIMSEIVDATTYDVERVDGMVVLHIRSDHRVIEGSGDANGLKTQYRPRSLPLPDHLAHRFWNYVMMVRQAYGEGPLFPMVNTSVRYGTRSDRVGAMIRKFTKKLGIVGTPYHWRHRVANQLKDMSPKLEPDDRRYVMGHAPVDVHAEHYLHFDPAKLKPFIDRVG